MANSAAYLCIAFTAHGIRAFKFVALSKRQKSTFGFKSRCFLIEEKTSTSNKRLFLVLLRELKDSLFFIKPTFDLKKRASVITVAASKAL